MRSRIATPASMEFWPHLAYACDMLIAPLAKVDVISRVAALREELEARGVAHIHLFGSVARGEAERRSDVELLVDLREPLGFAFFELEAFLSEMLGVRTELSTRASLRPRVLASAEKDLVPIF